MFELFDLSFSGRQRHTWDEGASAEGGETSTWGSGHTDRGFTGHRHDGWGLIYMNARYYATSVDRFISADTIVPDPADPQSFNRYSYGRNNPLRYTDLSGHKPCEWVCAGDWVPEGSFTGSAWHGEWNIAQQRANAARVEVLFVTLGETAAGVVWEPADWGLALRDGIQWHDTIGFLPIIPASVGRYTDDAAAAVGRHLTRFINRYGFEALNTVEGVVQPRFVGNFLAMGSSNFRQNLVRLTGFEPKSSWFQAHHVLPQKFEVQFAQLGINIHNPIYGSWVNIFDHQQWSNAYNQRWEQFFDEYEQLGRNPTLQEALDFGRILGEEYGFDINY